MRLGDSESSPRSLNGYSKPDNGNNAGGAIRLRNLPANTSREALRSMLLFAKDFTDADFVAPGILDDSRFLTAIAHFESLSGAEEAAALLNGKRNSNNDANMVVEVLHPSPISSNGNGLVDSSSSSNFNNTRRNTIDHSATNDLLGNVPSNGSLSRQPSRFNDTFQSLERLSVTRSAANNSSSIASSNNPSTAPNNPSIASNNNDNNKNGNNDARSMSESGAKFQDIFSPQSPIGNDLKHATGKDVIRQDPDEETGELLKDPVGYAENGHSARRSTNPHPPTNRFAGLSLSANVTSPPRRLPTQSYAPGGSGRVMPAPSSVYSQSMNSNNNNNNNSMMGGNHGYHFGNHHTPRHSLPAANPNDLNPPCNTLYVGNLPPDTSEEELKALFSKQRGYKRLCFRNKQNGPMCFVEFDEVAMASKSLNELYGYKLSNSVKTGIRLSFSKNPLGVRSGHHANLNAANNPLASPGSVPGGNVLGGLPHHPVFSTVSGPPPGLAVPPGLTVPVGMRGGGMHPSVSPQLPVGNGAFNANNGVGLRTNGLSASGLSTNGFNANSLNASGLGANCLDSNALSMNGLDANGLDANGLSTNGFNTNSLNTNVLNTNGLHTNGLNTNGLNGYNGLNRNGLNRNGLNRNGLNATSMNSNGMNTMSMTPSLVNGVGGGTPPAHSLYSTYYPDYMMGR